jgi:hypothetical protein
MANLKKTMSTGRQRKTNTRLRKFFACSDRAAAISTKFNTIYFVHMKDYRLKCLPSDITIDSLLQNQIVGKALLVRYDEETATAVIIAGRQNVSKKQLTFARKAVRKFHAGSGVTPVCCARSLRPAATIK